MKLVYILLISFICLSQINAQEEFPYTLTAEIGTYTELQNTTSVTNGEVWDDPAFTIIFPFLFPIMGDTILSINTSDDLEGGMLYAGNGNDEGINIIAPYFSDIVDRGWGSDVSESDIGYLTEGTAPNRILKVQWKNVGFWNEIDYFGSSISYTNFQLWLYEGSDKIEFRYGSSVITNPQIHDAGGSTAGFVKRFNLDSNKAVAFWNLAGNPMNPAIREALDIYIGTYQPGVFLVEPREGTIYTFSPLVSTSQKQVDHLTDVKVYPNRTSDVVYLENHSAEELQCNIITPNGMIVSSVETKNALHEIDLSKLGSGVYYVQLVQGKKVMIEKIFKN